MKAVLCEGQTRTFLISSSSFCRLYEIASSGESATSVKSSFKCPRDGHFGDKDDCAKFYRFGNKLT